MGNGYMEHSGKIENYRDLKVWQLGIDLVELIYKTAKQFPSEERYSLSKQLTRAAVSVPSNIAEEPAAL